MWDTECLLPQGTSLQQCGPTQWWWRRCHMWSKWHIKVLDSEEAPEEWQLLQWRYRTVVLPRTLASLTIKSVNSASYSYTVINWAAIPHCGHWNRSNSTFVKLAALKNTNVMKKDCALLFTMRSPAAQPDWNLPRDGITQSVRSLVSPPNSIQMLILPPLITLMHPRFWSDPFTDCNLGKLYRSCSVG